jgi:gas vesicle protein
MGLGKRVVRTADLLTQALGLAAELLMTVRNRTQKIRNTAYQKVENARNEGTVVAERLAESAQSRLHPARATGINVLKFAAGLSVGIGAGILLAPMSGKQMREKLLDTARGSGASSKSVVEGG